jgi:hypothetical protein
MSEYQNQPAETAAETPPSYLGEWLARYVSLKADIDRVVGAFLEHLQRLPDPQTVEEMRDLLRFRLKEFRLGMEQGPPTQQTRDRAADSAAAFLGDKQRHVWDAFRKLLDMFELTLQFDASRNANGLLAPDLLPKDALFTSGSTIYLTHRRSLPPDHPLRAIEGGNAVGWIPICEGREISRVDGSVTTLLPEWTTLAAVQQKVEEQAAEQEQQRRRDEEQRLRCQQESERQRRLNMSPEERLEERFRHLEERLAVQK